MKLTKRGNVVVAITFAFLVVLVSYIESVGM